LVNFRNVVREIDGGYIAVVDELSPQSEKEQVARFSLDTVGVLGLEGLMGECVPLVEVHNWDEEFPSEFPGPHKLLVFVLVLSGEVAGYMPVRWHWDITQKGRQLDMKGNPIEPNGKIQVHDVAELVKYPPIYEGPKCLESWGIEAVVILPSWQRQGLGKLLLLTGLHYLGTNEKEVAFDPPFTEAGEALLRSLGLHPAEVRLSRGI